MNGPRVTVSWAFDAGDGAGLVGSFFRAQFQWSPGSGVLFEMKIQSVNAGAQTAVWRCTIPPVSPLRTYDSAAVSYAGGSLALAIEWDEHSPVGGSQSTVRFLVNGAVVVSVQESWPDFEAPLLWHSWPIVAKLRSDLLAAGAGQSDLTVERWDSSMATVPFVSDTAARQETEWFGVRPPMGSGVVVGRSGRVACWRPSVNAVAPVQDWTHGPPATAYDVTTGQVWIRAGEGFHRGLAIGAGWTGIEPALYQRGGYLAARGLVTATSSSFGEVGSYGAVSLPPPFDAAAFVWSAGMTRAVCQQIVLGTDGYALGVMYDHDGAEALRVMDRDSNLFDVVDPVREAGGEASMPWPFLLRWPDGRWEVGAFDAAGFRSWLSDTVCITPSTVWTPLREDAMTPPAAELIGVNHWRGRSGMQVAAGYHRAADGSGEPGFRAFIRPSSESAWEGPSLEVASELAAAPYVYEDERGAWRVGWRLGEVWHEWSAHDPSGTWQELA